MSKDSKKIKHDLHDDADFKLFLQDKLKKDYFFFDAAQKLYDESSYENKNYNENFTANSLNNFQANESPLEYKDELRALIASNINSLEKSLSSDEDRAKKIKKRIKKWEKVLGDFGHSIDTFKALCGQ